MTDMPVCNVFRYWPDDSRAVCSCGWMGNAHIFVFLARWDLRRHSAHTGHFIEYPEVRWARPRRDVNYRW